MAPNRKTRSNGQASREKILDAATTIAGERGYEGTSISAVSKASGLPASSIYWHFKNKDDLIAAIIERSFTRWTADLDQGEDQLPPPADEAAFRQAITHTGEAITRSPDFLRLGLLLVLEHRPSEPTARAKFMDVRLSTAERLRDLYRHFFADLDEDAIDSLATISMALADGFFIASEAEETDLSAAFGLMATTVLGAANQMRPRPSSAK